MTFEEGSEGYAYLAEYIQGAKLKPVRSFQNKEGRSIVDLEVFEPDDDSREWVKGIAKAVVRTKAWDVRKLTSIFSDKKQAPPKIETRNELRLFPNVFHLKI
ncbi:MAG: hypothetical protein KKB70_01765, partial [Proteobacteria bacterium]|nr:hypothetical protein [Pseudomonadota bacterium]